MIVIEIIRRFEDGTKSTQNTLRAELSENPTTEGIRDILDSMFNILIEKTEAPK